MEFSPRRAGKTVVAVEATRALQRAGKTVLWATSDQTGTAQLLAKHGALSLVIGELYLGPYFRAKTGDSHE